mmetsp:Transcript_31060/g.41171  ORF Transcript_31060/g.41171 Transcript_31060/m.41171 type:complete len:85 (+) Transcript_31060:881-1135(+)
MNTHIHEDEDLPKHVTETPVFPQAASKLRKISHYIPITAIPDVLQSSKGDRSLQEAADLLIIESGQESKMSLLDVPPATEGIQE